MLSAAVCGCCVIPVARYFTFDWMSASQSDESTHIVVNQCLKYVTQVQQQQPESPMLTDSFFPCLMIAPRI